MAAMGALLIVIQLSGQRRPQKHSGREIAIAWAPYMLLVIFVLLWGYKPFQVQLKAHDIPVNWPWLHNTIMRVPPAVSKPAPYAAVYTFTWLSASGTACLFAAILGSIVVGLKPRQFMKVLGETARQLVKAELTLAIVLGLAMLMNYSGSTATPGTVVRRHRRAVSVLQRAAGMARRLSHRQRYQRQCAVRDPAGGDGSETGAEPGADGGG